MERFESHLENGTFAVEGRNGWIVVGPMEEIVEALGEVYEVEYDERQALIPWLGTDDGVLQIKFRETLTELSFDEEFVARLSPTLMSDASPALPTP